MLLDLRASCRANARLYGRLVKALLTVVVEPQV